MHVKIVAIGSRGDVQPLLALGLALQCTGRHQVSLVASDDFAALAAAHGLDFIPLGLSAQALLRAGGLGAGMEAGRNTLVWVAQVLRSLAPAFERLMENTWAACQGAQAIIFSSMALGAYHVAEALGVPAFWAVPFPGLPPTAAFPSVSFPALPLGGRYNRWTHLAGNFALHALTGRFFNRWRRQRLGLAALPLGTWPYSRLHGRPLPILYSFSPLVFPPAPEWGEHVHLTGYWSLDPPPGWQPPPGLLDFLDAGPPPVYAGFGSMISRDPRQAALLVQQALERAGQRGVIASGWGGLVAEGLDPRRIFCLSAIPHAWLFPRMAAVIHHGGSGTTGAGLCAGVPSILVPHAGDQPLSARRVAALGAGPPAIPRRQLSVDRLAAAITAAVTDQEMRQRAAALGERLRAEDGLGRAVAVIQAL